MSTSDSGVAQAPEEGRTTAWSARVRRIFETSGMFPALVLLIVLGYILSPTFLTTINISNVVRLGAVLGLITLGQALVIISGGGGIDLSVGSVMAAAGIIGAMFQDYGLGAVILGTIAGGAFFGVMNGLGVTTAGLQPFITTLATRAIAVGVAFQLTAAQPVILDTPGLSYLSEGTIWSIPVPIVILLVALIVGQFAMSRTTFGRNLYAVGGNEDAAFASGVSVKRYRFGVYVISGLLAGLAAVLGIAQLNTADPNFGNGYELQAIAAAVVGGAVLSGGRGTIVGIAVGIAILALLGNLLNLLNVNPALQAIATGLIVIIAVALNRQGEGSDDKRVMKGLPLYAALGVGAVLLILMSK